MSAHRVASAAAMAACLAWMGVAAAQEGPRLALTTSLDISSDTDGFRAARARVGGLFPYENPWKYSGVALQSSRYLQGSFRETANGVLGIYRDQRRDTLAGVDIEAGVTRVAGRLRPIGDATWRIAATPTTAVDFGASADLVETPLAIERGIAYSFFTAGVEQQLGERFTVTGMGGYQRFTDGNERAHLRARLIWLAVPEHGVTLQMRYRQFDSRLSDVGGAYFNPDTYRQWLGVVAMRKRFEGWTLVSALGAGKERSETFDARNAYLAELRAEVDLPHRARLVLRGGYYRGASFFDSPDYAYRAVGVSLVVPF